MHQYKIIARILLILPIINFAFAIPIAVEETRQVCCDVPDVAIAIPEKRGEEIKKPWDMHFERMSGKPESSLAAHRASGSARSESDDVSVNGNTPRQSPDDASTSSPQMGTGQTQQVSQELSKSPSLDNHVQAPSELSKSPSLDHYVQTPPELSKSPSLDHYWQKQPELSKSPSWDHLVQTQLELSKSLPLDLYKLLPPPPSSESGAHVDDTISRMKNFKLKSAFKNVISKLKLRRHMSGPGFARDAELRGLVDTAGTTVRDIGKPLNVPPTPATGGVRRTATGEPS